MVEVSAPSVMFDEDWLADEPHFKDEIPAIGLGRVLVFTDVQGKQVDVGDDDVFGGPHPEFLMLCKPSTDKRSMVAWLDEPKHRKMLGICIEESSFIWSNRQQQLVRTMSECARDTYVQILSSTNKLPKWTTQDAIDYCQANRIAPERCREHAAQNMIFLSTMIEVHCPNGSSSDLEIWIAARAIKAGHEPAWTTVTTCKTFTGIPAQFNAPFVRRLELVVAWAQEVKNA